MNKLGLLSVVGMMLTAGSVGVMAQESSSKTPTGQSQGQVQQVPSAPGAMTAPAPGMTGSTMPYSGSSTAPYSSSAPTTGTGSNAYETGHMK